MPSNFVLYLFALLWDFGSCLNPTSVLAGNLPRLEAASCNQPSVSCQFLKSLQCYLFCPACALPSGQSKTRIVVFLLVQLSYVQFSLLCWRAVHVCVAWGWNQEIINNFYGVTFLSSSLSAIFLVPWSSSSQKAGALVTTLCPCTSALCLIPLGNRERERERESYEAGSILLGQLH